MLCSRQAYTVKTSLDNYRDTASDSRRFARRKIHSFVRSFMAPLTRKAGLGREHHAPISRRSVRQGREYSTTSRTNSRDCGLILIRANGSVKHTTICCPRVGWPGHPFIIGNAESISKGWARQDANLAMQTGCTTHGG